MPGECFVRMCWVLGSLNSENVLQNLINIDELELKMKTGKQCAPQLSIVAPVKSAEKEYLDIFMINQCHFARLSDFLGYSAGL